MLKKNYRQDKTKELPSNKGKVPTRFQGMTYVPSADATLREWLHPSKRSTTDRGKWKVVNVGYGSPYKYNSQVLKKYSYVSQNCMGKNPMTRTHWRRHHRNKKVTRKARSSSGSDSIQIIGKGQSSRWHVKKRLFPPLSPINKEKETKDKVVEDVDLKTDDLDSRSEPKLDIICNMISVFPLEYDTDT